MTEKAATSADELAISHSEYHGNVGKSKATAEIANIYHNGVDVEMINDIVQKHGSDKDRAELTMFQMFLQTAMAEVAEYNGKIAEAKTQAKRDYYQKKIKNVTKRLQKLLP